jgi:hypothetical protein
MHGLCHRDCLTEFVTPQAPRHEELPDDLVQAVVAPVIWVRDDEAVVSRWLTSVIAREIAALAAAIDADSPEIHAPLATSVADGSNAISGASIQAPHANGLLVINHGAIDELQDCRI